jgi:hypothetical protein
VKIREHSDYANSDAGAPAIRGGGLVLEWVVDAEGWVLAYDRLPDGSTVALCTFRNGRGKESGDLMQALTLTAMRYPLPAEDVVWPEPGWPVDSDGRGLAVMDVRGARYLRLEQHIIARQTRAWERQNATTHGAIVTALRAA